VKLTKRVKWLIGTAALVGAWVAFGPKDPAAVEPARGAAMPAARAAHVVAGSAKPAPVAHSLLALAHRVAEQTAAGSLFAVHAWYVPPPAPPAPPAAADSTPPAPPQPTAPPLPYQLLGSYTPQGEPTVFFLRNGERVYDVHVGDTLDNTYSIDSFRNGQLVLTYKPLRIQQQLSTGVGQ